MNHRIKNVVGMGFFAIMVLMAAQAGMFTAMNASSNSYLLLLISAIFLASGAAITLYVTRKLNDRESACVIQSAKAEKQASKLRWQASHDSLTRLTNRREFRRRVEAACRSAQTGNQQHALLLMDLDRFKTINDHCGHRAGDTLLQQLPEVLRPLLRNTDTLARISGDEFGVLLPNSNVQRGRDVAEAMRKAVRQFRFPWGGRYYEIGVSIGVVPISEDHCHLQEVLTAADSACYEAKDAGRNRVCVLNTSDKTLAERLGKIRCAQELPQAIRDNQLELFAQEIRPIDGGYKERHYELLVRMRRENGELRSPADFIPVAEQYGIAADLDRWVICEAIQWLKGQQSKIGVGCSFGHNCKCDCKISINLSGQSLSDSAFLKEVEAILRKGDVDPRLIIFEITETAIITNLAVACKFIKTLKRYGVKFALDDFGSGMAGFGYLKHLDIDYVKIDGSLIKEIASHGLESAMVDAIVHVANHMNALTIAEYVEDELTQHTLENSGVDYVQGFLVHKPMPLANLSFCSSLPEDSQQLVLVA